jgi:hypothetical protein
MKLEDALDIQILRMHAGRSKKHCIFPNLQTLVIKTIHAAGFARSIDFTLLARPRG